MARNSLTHAESAELAAWVKANYEAGQARRWTHEQAARLASQTLAFTVTKFNVQGALRSLKLRAWTGHRAGRAGTRAKVAKVRWAAVVEDTSETGQAQHPTDRAAAALRQLMEIVAAEAVASVRADLARLRMELSDLRGALPEQITEAIDRWTTGG